MKLLLICHEIRAILQPKVTKLWLQVEALKARLTDFDPSRQAEAVIVSRKRTPLEKVIADHLSLQSRQSLLKMSADKQDILWKKINLVR